MADVFISYSRQDEAFARRLHQGLEAQGRDAYMDVEDIPASDRWRNIRARFKDSWPVSLSRESHSMLIKSRYNYGSRRDCGAGCPPAAAQGDVEGGGILEAEGPGLDHADPGLLVLIIGGEDLEVVDQAGLVVGFDELQGLGRRRLRPRFGP